MSLGKGVITCNWSAEEGIFNGAVIVYSKDVDKLCDALSDDLQMLTNLYTFLSTKFPELKQRPGL